MPFKITPMPGYIVVEPISEDDLNKSELATLENEREHISTGKAIKVSKYAGTFENYGFQFASEVKEGDIIAYIQYSEHPLRVNGQEYHVVRFDKVIAVVSEKK